jgi:hypothetical protein
MLHHQDRSGSPRFRDASFSVRAVLSDPAGVSSPLAFCGSLLVPSKFSTLSASGISCNEAQSLHLRYGLDVALPTLSPCCCLHEPKARFQVRRLVPLAWTGIAPAESARLSLAHQRTSPDRDPRPNGGHRRYTAAPWPRPDAPSAAGESRDCVRKTSRPICLAEPASPPAG